jgi:hypothetical protein
MTQINCRALLQPAVDCCSYASSSFATAGLKPHCGASNGSGMDAILAPSSFPVVTETEPCRRWSRAQEENPVVLRLAIAFVLAQAATAGAQDTKSGQSQTPTVVGANGTRPFLFDGRMRGDGVRRRALADSSPQCWRHRRATESKPAWGRTISPRTLG